MYPPVETRLFKSSERRRGRIVSVGRITPSKRYQTVLEVARELPDLEFIICGLKQDESYFRKLMEGRPRNVHIKTDITFDSLRKELAASKVYLHCMREEHFGISIVEAMAAGCVPVVHDSGGPREIVTPECGFRFTSLTEAVEMISMVIEEAEVFSRLSLNARKRAEEYDVENFNRSIISALQSVTGKRDIT